MDLFFKSHIYAYLNECGIGEKKGRIKAHDHDTGSNEGL